LGAELKWFIRIFNHLLRLIKKMEKADPYFKDYQPNLIARLNNYVNLIKRTSNLFQEFYFNLDSIKDVEEINSAYYKKLRQNFLLIWRIRKLYNNNDFPKRILCKDGKPIDTIDVVIFIVGTGKQLHEQKRKIFKIMNIICSKLSKYLLEKEPNANAPDSF
jgi:hypothetical protein